MGAGLAQSRPGTHARGAALSPARPRQEVPCLGEPRLPHGPGPWEQPWATRPPGSSTGSLGGGLPARLNIPLPAAPPRRPECPGTGRQQKRGIVYTCLWTPLGERWACTQPSKHTRTGMSGPWTLLEEAGRPTDPSDPPPTHTQRQKWLTLNTGKERWALNTHT